MTRVNVYSQDEYEPRTLLGWFDTSSAELFEQAKEWDGSNMIGVITKDQWIDEYLYRTKGGRWVLNKDAHRYMNGPDTYEFIAGDEAQDWLLRSEANDEAVERYFGEIEDERGPGRPEVGAAVHVRLGDDLLAMVDAYASERGIKRAEAIRRLTTDAVTRDAANAGPLTPQVNR
jgi:hypothetical protein